MDTKQDAPGLLKWPMCEQLNQNDTVHVDCVYRLYCTYMFAER